MKLHQAEHAAQKARREAEKKTQEEAERQRVAEEKKRKRRMIEYQRSTMEVLQRRWRVLTPMRGV